MVKAGVEIDHIAEGADEHALLDKARAQSVEIGDRVHLNHADRALHAHVLDTRHAAAGREAFAITPTKLSPLAASRGSRSNRSSEALAAAQASALAMKVGPCISAFFGSSDQKASNTLRVRDGRGERQRAAGQRLRQRDDVGRDARRLAGEHRAGAAEAGEDLVEDQQQLVFVGERAQAAQHARRRERSCRRRPAPAARR